jgi:D-3-phosphoglycerate dehydrogenase
LRVLITEKIHESGIQFLKEQGLEVELLYENDNDVMDAVSKADGMVVRLVKVDEQLLRKGGANHLRVVAKHGVGVDNIDLKAAKELGIRVVYTPTVMINAVAEFTLGAILLLAKKFLYYDSEVRGGEWSIRYSVNSLELQGKTLGLIGYGRIGHRVAELARCIGINTVVYDPYFQGTKEHLEQVNLETLLRTSDFISIHTPLTKETFHLIGKNELKIIKKGIYVINTARGGIIDETALIEALENHKIAGAVLDVTEQEPIAKDNPLLRCKNVILTAHTAGLTDVSQVNESLLACQQLYLALIGKEPDYELT